MDDEKLTKVHVALPHHWAVGGESMWAVDLGDDLYELRNTPFHAYDLNFGDVVRAISASPDLKPVIREVVRRSGHRTIRVFFQKSVPEDRRLERLHSLHHMSVSIEGANAAYFALDLQPEADLDLVRQELDKWEREGWIEYETCDARMPGSFDDRPEEASGTGE